MARRQDAPGVWIASNLAAALRTEAGSYAPLETGGMLLGFAVPEEGGYVVGGLIPGGPGARRSQRSFRPDGPWQQTHLSWAYERSGRMQTYLGDWHSHPAGGTTLSWRDWLTALRVARAPAARAPQPLSILVSGTGAGWTLSAWQLRQLRPVNCEVYEVGGAEFVEVAR